jgi:hypothetical protein
MGGRWVTAERVCKQNLNIRQILADCTYSYPVVKNRVDIRLADR